jgi:PRTRC genetic system protein F
MMSHPLSLPALSRDVPTRYCIPGEAILATPLAIALLDADLITDSMLAEPGAHEHKLVEQALSTWWMELNARNPMKYFRWTLHVQELDDLTGRHEQKTSPPVAWFCVSQHRDFEVPRWTLQRRLLELEDLLPGFGQEVLAVLLHTCLHLPNALDPWRAADWAEWLWWGHSENDADLIEQFRADNGYETAEDVLRDSDVMTRERFYEHMPRWVTAPRQTLPKDTLVAAATTPFARDVIAACDALSAFASSSAFTLSPSDVGSHRTGHEMVGGCMVLLWTCPGVIGQAIDEAVDLAYQGGECVEFIDSYPLELNGAAFQQYAARTEQILQLATLAERLIELIGEPV